MLQEKLVDSWSSSWSLKQGGVLASWGQDPSAVASPFQLSVSLSGTSNKTVRPPKNIYMFGLGQVYARGVETIVPSSVFVEELKSWVSLTFAIYKLEHNSCDFVSLFFKELFFN